MPALEPPDDAVRDRVHAIATSAPDLTEWWKQAGGAGLGADDVDALLAAILHPLPVDRADLVDHCFYQQVAAIMLIARTDTKWFGSRRRDALLSLLHGPQGWVTAATVLVLTELAVHEPRAFGEIREELADLAFHMPDRGHVAFADALDEATRRLPFFPPDAAREVHTWLKDLYGDPSDDELPPEPPRGGPPPPSPVGNPVVWMLVLIGVIFALVFMLARSA